jgi:hypothetical protein
MNNQLHEGQSLCLKWPDGRVVCYVVTRTRGDPILRESFENHMGLPVRLGEALKAGAVVSEGDADDFG